MATGMGTESIFTSQSLSAILKNVLERFDENRDRDYVIEERVHYAN